MKKLTTSKKGFAPVLIVIFVFLISSIYLLAWAPWVNYQFAYNKALKSLDSSCRQLNRDEYSAPVVLPYWKLPTLPEWLGLVPPFGREVTLYVMCGEQSSENLYFVSFLGTVKLKESKPIPHRVSVERSQNTIEKIDETMNWKIFTNTTIGYSVKYPPAWGTLEKTCGDFFSSGVGSLYKADLCASGARATLSISLTTNLDKRQVGDAVTFSKTILEGSDGHIINYVVRKKDKSFNFQYTKFEGEVDISKTIETIIKTLVLTSDEAANWKTYTNENGKYSIKYPPGWKAFDDVNNINSGRLEPTNTEYIRTNWNGKDIKNYKVGIYTAVNEGSSACETNKEEIKISGLIGYKGKEQQGDGNIYAICGTVNKNGASYVITLEDKDFSRETLFNQILSTFRFTN